MRVPCSGEKVMARRTTRAGVGWARVSRRRQRLSAEDRGLLEHAPDERQDGREPQHLPRRRLEVREPDDVFGARQAAPRRRTALRALVLAGIAAALLGVFFGPGRLLPTEPPDLLPPAQPEPPEGSPYACRVEPLTEDVELELLTSGPSTPGRRILESKTSPLAYAPTGPGWIIDEAGYFWIVSGLHVPDGVHGLIGRVPKSVLDDMRARMRRAGRELVLEPLGGPLDPIQPCLGCGNFTPIVTLDVGPTGAEDRVLLCEYGRHHASPEAWRILRWLAALRKKANEHPILVAGRQWPHPVKEP
jgi:hypothetical protein